MRPTPESGWVNTHREVGDIQMKREQKDELARSQPHPTPSLVSVPPRVANVAKQRIMPIAYAKVLFGGGARDERRFNDPY